MFYKTLIEDFIRVPPDKFGDSVEDAIISQVKKQYDGFISKDMGVVIDVVSTEEISEGIIILAMAQHITRRSSIS
jgi:DNA-directed RNA polymerase subunit E'/Rpb7